MFPTRTQEDIEQRQENIRDAFKNYYQRLERFSKEPMTHKRILLIGRTRAGKTTFKQMLKDPQEVPGELSLISQTKKSDFDTFDIPESNLTLTVVDTPGLFDRHTNTDETSSIDEDLNKINIQCLNMQITEFHLVCFCASFEAGINDQDLEAIRRLIDHFGPELSEHLCMTVTRFESKNDEQRTRLRAEIEHDTYFQSIACQFHKGIHFSGALKRDDWNQGSDALLIQFKNICEYRRQLLKVIKQSTTTYKVKPIISSPAQTTSRRPEWRSFLFCCGCQTDD